MKRQSLDTRQICSVRETLPGDSRRPLRVNRSPKLEYHSIFANAVKGLYTNPCFSPRKRNSICRRFLYMSVPLIAGVGFGDGLSAGRL